MPTVINNPPGESGGSGMSTGLILGIIITVLIVGVIFFMNGGLGLFGNQQKDTNDINIEIPNPLDDQNQNPAPTK